jgi:hypothetical protein
MSTVVVDQYEIPVRMDAPAGEYRIETGMYDATTGERLSVFTSQGQPVVPLSSVVALKWAAFVIARSAATKQSPACNGGDCFAPYGRSQ